MIKKITLLILSAFFVAITYSQTENFNVESISEALKENANSVIRFENYQIELRSQREMIIKYRTAITVFNELADAYANLTLAYDKRRTIKNVKIYYFDAFGKEIKKVRKKDFKDYSASDGISLYNDGRLIHYNYTPTTYPYTVYYEYEIKTSNTAFIPSWSLYNGYNQSIEKTTFAFTYPTDITLLKSEKNLEGFPIEKMEKDGLVSYTVNNIKAIKREPYAPKFSAFLPTVKLGVNKFNLEGIDGEAANWQEFGKWFYKNLIQNTIDLPESTKIKIKELTKDAKNPSEKAKIVYQYVQDKVRYISIQIGIGGFKPMKVSEVDNLSYGDCKGLSNYTAALLKEVGIEAYHALIYAGRQSKKNINSNVVSQQGNHMVLYVPILEEDLWLECTSQNTPFADGGDFTDDRDALVITPKGGIIKHTRVYDDKENLQKINANYILKNDGSITANVSIVCSGTQFDNHLGYENLASKKIEKRYKEYWSNINNISIEKTNIVNNKEQGKFEETISFTAQNYGTTTGERMLFAVNAFNVSSYIPKRIRNRKLPLEITRGFYDIDQVEITLPSDYKIESIPENSVIETKFGVYKMTIKKINENTLKYTREYLTKGGSYPKEAYKSFRDFKKSVVKKDKSKIVLIKK